MVFGLASSQTRVALELVNSKEKNVTTYLEFNPVFLEYINLFNAKGDLLDATGSKVENSETQGFPRLKIDLPPGKHRFYSSIKSRSSSLAMMIRSEKKQSQKNCKK